MNEWIFVPAHWDLLWQEDECAPDRETSQEAWHRFFGELIPRTAIAEDDRGDGVFRLHEKNRVYYFGFDGGAIYVVTPSMRFEREWNPLKDTKGGVAR